MSLKAILERSKTSSKGEKRISDTDHRTTTETNNIYSQNQQFTTEQGQELAIKEIRNPPVVFKKTKPLQMGDKVKAPSFGSSTYDWVMRKGRGLTQLMNG